MSNQLENIKLRSEEVQEILTKVPHWMIRWGNVLFLCIILLLLLISWLVKYPDIITSNAIITTHIPPQKIHAKTTGNLEVILVEDLELLLKNQPIAIIENTADYKDVFILKAIIDTLKTSNKTLRFPFDNMPVLSLGPIESSYAIFEGNYLQYCLNQELRPFTNKAIANNISILELKKRLQNVQAQKGIQFTELAFKKKDLSRNKFLYDKGIISTHAYELKQLEFAQFNREFQNHEAVLSQIREALSNANRTSKGVEINRIMEEMVLHKNVVQSLNQLKKAIKDWEYLYVLQPNTEGYVAFIDIWSANQSVQQGDLIFSVIPCKNTTYIAKLKTPSLNYGKIKIGQSVHLKLDNYPDIEFGVLNGIVKKIGQIPNKNGRYNIDVQLPKKLITSYNKEIIFKHEMTAKAEILNSTNKRNFSI